MMCSQTGGLYLRAVLYRLRALQVCKKSTWEAVAQLNGHTHKFLKHIDLAMYTWLGVADLRSCGVQAAQEHALHKHGIAWRALSVQMVRSRLKLTCIKYIQLCRSRPPGCSFALCMRPASRILACGACGLSFSCMQYNAGSAFSHSLLQWLGSLLG